MTYFLLEVFFINSRFEFFRLYLGQKIGSEFIPYVYGILLIALFPTMQDQIIKKNYKVNVFKKVPFESQSLFDRNRVIQNFLVTIFLNWDKDFLVCLAFFIDVSRKHITLFKTIQVFSMNKSRLRKAFLK